MGRNPQTGALEPLDFDHLASEMYEFRYLKASFDTYQFTPPIDSSDISPRQWAQLVRIIADRYEEYDGFVILHGTDTMAYTASALSFMLENLTKPVILTGSQLPIGQLRTDGKENLITSIELAADAHDDGTPMVPEVCIYFNGKLIRGNRSTKIAADGFNAFDSFNYPVLCHAGVNFVYHEHHILKPDYTQPMVPHTAMDPHVLVFSLFPGIDESVFQHRNTVVWQWQCPPTTVVVAIVQRSLGARHHRGEHQPMRKRYRGDEPLRHRLSTAKHRCHQRSRQYGRSSSDQTDVSASPLHRRQHHPHDDEPQSGRRGDDIRSPTPTHPRGGNV